MKTLGILGGGQLSKLLSLKAQKLGFKTFVLSESPEDPAAQGNPFWILGNPAHAKDLQAFLKKVDLLTFESEFFPAKFIQQALKNRGKKGLGIAPSLKVFSLFQDRWTQKKLLSKYQLPTADYWKWDLKLDKKEKLFQLWEKLGSFVLKSRTGGYDGYGTFLIKKREHINGLKLSSEKFIAEQFIPFQRELAILAARNKQGQIVFFPLVESFQKDSRCLWIKGPEKHKKLNVLKRKICFFLNDLAYEGLIAFELFDTGEDLLINELAPRVHNSGHYSLEALDQDQFTAHLKAVQGQALNSPKLLKPGFAMYNLLGEGSKEPVFKKNQNSHLRLKDIINKPTPLKYKGFSLYWYGKTISRKGRKMGHLSATASSANQALKKLLKVRSYFKV